jgi:hypothetical protein
MIKAAIVLGVLIILAAVLFAGRYSLTQQGSLAFVVDRYMGTVSFCSRDGCSIVRQLPAPSQDMGAATESQKK